MRKTIIFKKPIITEASITYNGDQKVIDKINKRVIRVLRTAEAAEQAAATAKEQGNDDLAAELAARAEELRNWANLEDNKFRSNVDKPQETANKAEDAPTDSGEKAEQEEPEEKPDSKLAQEPETNQSTGTSSSNQSDGSNSDSSNDTADSDSNEDDAEEDDIEENSTNNDDAKSEEEKDKGKEPENTDEPEEPDEPSGPHGGDGDPGTPIEDDIEDDSENESDSQDDIEDDSEEDEDEDETDFGGTSGDSGRDGEEGDTEQQDDEPFENPFEEDPDNANKLEPSGEENNRQPTPEEEFENMKRVLKILKGGEKDGAKKAFDEILSGLKTESLTEAMRPISQDITVISDEDFEDIINDTLDNINKIKPVNISTDLETRVKEIEKDNSDLQLNQELDADDKENTAEEHAKQKAAKKELEKYRTARAGNTEVFKNMLRRAISSQVAAMENEEDSWGAINRRHQDDDVVVPGKIIDDVKKKVAVSIQVYLDCSGSFDEYDIERERSFLGVVDKFVQAGKVVIDLIYFANNLHSTYNAARAEGGTGAWSKIVENIRKTKPDNVLIVTDSDMEYSARAYPAGYSTKGCVWYIWKESDAESLKKRINGYRGTYEYWL